VAQVMQKILKFSALQYWPSPSVNYLSSEYVCLRWKVLTYFQRALHL